MLGDTCRLNECTGHSKKCIVVIPSPLQRHIGGGGKLLQLIGCFAQSTSAA